MPCPQGPTSCFCPNALTGLINNDDPAHDLPGQTVPGPATTIVSGALCPARRLGAGFGIWSGKSTSLYDSAVLLKPDRSIALVYRRNQPPMARPASRSRDLPPGHGTARRRQHTSAPVGFLLCGDLFDDDIIARFRGLSVDWMLFPFARCFADGTADQVRWGDRGAAQYAQRIRMAGTPALMVNYLADASLGDDNSFGGACAISATGEVVASAALGRRGHADCGFGHTIGQPTPRNSGFMRDIHLAPISTMKK